MDVTYLKLATVKYEYVYFSSAAESDDSGRPIRSTRTKQRQVYSNLFLKTDQKGTTIFNLFEKVKSTGRTLRWMQNWVLGHIYKSHFSVFRAMSCAFGFEVGKKCSKISKQLNFISIDMCIKARIR